MATYDELAQSKISTDDLKDELKPNGVDLLLPYADFESGWILLSRGATVTISHNLGVVPRLCTLHLDITANFTANTKFDNGADNTSTMSVQSLQINTCDVINKSQGTSYKYFYLRLWR